MTKGYIGPSRASNRDFRDDLWTKGGMGRARMGGIGMVRNDESRGGSCAQPSYDHPTDQRSLGVVISG